MSRKRSQILIFLKRVGLFVLLFLGIVLALELSCNYIISSKADFKLGSTYQYAIFGNSRPECAFDDTLIDNFKNLSQSGESYFYTQIKLKEILDNNPELSTIFIGYGNSNINIENKQKMFQQDALGYRNPIYSPFFSVEDYRFLLSVEKAELKSVLQTYPISLRRKIIRVVRQNFRYLDEIGGYQSLTTNQIDSLVRVFDTIQIKPLTEREIFTESIDYLREMVDLCKEKNKKVYLVRCPQHSGYPFRINEKIQLKILDDFFSDVVFLDFSKFPIADEEFMDFTHLNQKGAERFSTWFNELLSKGLIEQDNPQTIINLEIEELSKID